MKKKIMSILLASTIAVTALGLTACKDDGDGDDGMLKSEKVSSAEAWAAAFDFSEVTNATVVMDGWEQRVITLYFDGDKYKRDDGERVKYIRYDDELYDDHHKTQYDYTYDDEAEKWTVSKHGTFDKMTVMTDGVKYFNRMTSAYDEESGEVKGDVAERYAEFSYSDTEYAYVATYNEISYYTDVKITVKIKGGKFVYGTMTGTYNDNGTVTTATVTMTLKDIGTTVVTLPNVEE